MEAASTLRQSAQNYTQIITLLSEYIAEKVSERIASNLVACIATNQDVSKDGYTINRWEIRNMFDQMLNNDALITFRDSAEREVETYIDNVENQVEQNISAEEYELFQNVVNTINLLWVGSDSKIKNFSSTTIDSKDAYKLVQKNFEKAGYTVTTNESYKGYNFDLVIKF